MKVQNLVRKNIRLLQPYSCAREEYAGSEAIFLDANENPFDNGFNRYPDPYQRMVKKKLAAYKQVEESRLILGNGSDEIIDLLIRSLCQPREDNLIVFSPGYSMYEVCGAINDVEIRKINLQTDLQPDWKEVERQSDASTKLIFLCTPNNPLGNVIPLAEIEKICEKFTGLVVVDEAYIDFTEFPSALTLLRRHENLFVLQTLSKAWGMAGLRLGIGYGTPALIGILNRVKAPYNISVLTQRTVLDVLEQREEFQEKLRVIKKERERLFRAFVQLDIFRSVFPSEANFILVTLDDFRELYDFLVQQKMVVRLRNILPLVEGGLRISIGVPEENDRLLALLAEWKSEKRQKYVEEKNIIRRQGRDDITGTARRPTDRFSGKIRIYSGSYRSLEAACNGDGLSVCNGEQSGWIGNPGFPAGEFFTLATTDASDIGRRRGSF